MRRVLALIVALLLLAGSGFFQLVAQTSREDYRGKVFKEIRIDDKGIVLIDTLGNKVEVSRSEVEAREGRIIDDRPDAPPVEGDELMEGCQRTYDKITKVGGSLILDEDECVDGDVVVIGGNVTIRGVVRGSVTATGRVVISATGVVMGDVVGSRVTEESGAEVLGTTSEQRVDFSIPDTEWEEQSASTAVTFVLLAVELALVVVVSLLFRKPVDRFKEAFAGNVFKMLLVGFLIELAFIPALILLLITIVGIPIVVIMPFAFLGAGILGMTAFCLYISDFVRAKEGSGEEGRLTKTLIGFFILQAPAIGMFFGLVIDFRLMSILFLIISSILAFIVFTASLGAAALTRFGSRDYAEKSKSTTVTVEVNA